MVPVSGASNQRAPWALWHAQFCLIALLKWNLSDGVIDDEGVFYILNLHDFVSGNIEVDVDLTYFADFFPKDEFILNRLPPVTTIWSDLKNLLLPQAYDSMSDEIPFSGGTLYIDTVLRDTAVAETFMHQLVFAKQDRDIVFVNPRYAVILNMCYAVIIVGQDNPTLIPNLLMKPLNAIDLRNVYDGTYGGFVVLRTIACHWLRLRAAARTIQRAFRMMPFASS